MTNDDKEMLSVSKSTPLEHSEEDMEYNDEGDLVPKKYVGSLTRNPHGVNGHMADPRQELMWKLYIQGLAKVIPNAKKAASTAGYSPNFAANIVNSKWFKERKEKLKRKNFLTRAERNLGRLLDLEWTSMKLVSGEMEEVNDIDKIRVVADISKYVTQTLGKDAYSTKTIEEKNVAHDIKIESVSYADNIQIENKDKIIEVIEEEIKEIHNE